MSDVWIDANVVLRVLTDQPPDQAEAANRLLQRAVDGELTLRCNTVVVAEIIWVLGSFYKWSRRDVADVLIPFLSAEGLRLENAGPTLAAIELMASANVAFADALLASMAQQSGAAVASFDRNFARLGVEWIEPMRDGG